jgi:hypothetical protein
MKTSNLSSKLSPSTYLSKAFSNRTQFIMVKEILYLHNSPRLCPLLPIPFSEGFNLKDKRVCWLLIYQELTTWTKYRERLG